MSIFLIILSILGILLVVNFLLLKFSCNKVSKNTEEEEHDYSMADK